MPLEDAMNELRRECRPNRGEIEVHCDLRYEVVTMGDRCPSAEVGCHIVVVYS